MRWGMDNRESFGSRLGFILVSAGCAIGIGNVWRFPYITGKYGGAAFVLIYLIFLILLGLPVMTMEFAVGRASKKSIGTAFSTLKPDKKAWNITSWFGIVGNYMLMMYYTTVSGWMLCYIFKMAGGEFKGMNVGETGTVFNDLLASPVQLVFWMLVTIAIGFIVCSFGLQNGVEKVTKPLMVSMFILMFILCIRSLALPGGEEGLKFYLVPDLKRLMDNGIFTVISAAMGQAFFTLSIGMGSMLIFGSYITKEHTLTSESITVIVLDTAVAIMSGLIIFPACYAYNVDPGSGPGLVFVTLPEIFIQMSGGRFWGTLFFIFNVSSITA
jgi:NSS family neurotransmitter:Na+ symporter